MKTTIPDSRIAGLKNKTISKAFEAYQAQFNEITLRAQERFENCDWHGSLADAKARLEAYREIINPTLDEIHAMLGERLHDKFLWVGAKAVYSNWAAERNDWEIAETFFNSIIRRIFSTVGVDKQIEFVDTDFIHPPTQAKQLVYTSYEQVNTLESLVETMLSDHPFHVEYQHWAQDVATVAERLRQRLQQLGLPLHIDQADMVNSLFYRGRVTYLVGRMVSGGQMFPIAIALLNYPTGIVVDAVIFDEDIISILFSFAHSYFRVYTRRPYDLVQFLASIMPRKKIAELYTSIGHNKHGKTEFYRDLLHHLRHTDDQFIVAAGEVGMVMLVFTMPSYEVVFKIIRDRFAQPKDSTRRQVMEKYRLVFRHDRAGRLVDAQEFEHLKFMRRNFSETLLEQLLHEASQTVSLEGDYVIINHAYIERRVTPLNIYVVEADPAAAEAAVIDYGKCLKDLIATNIFPGDLLLKNFGVTRHGRVVFYDYDELCLLTECKFRRLPPSRGYEDDFFVDTWFSVGEHDVFPEQFPSFLGLAGHLRDVFLQHHRDLFEAEYWQQMQERIKAGELPHIIPYRQSSRLG